MPSKTRPDETLDYPVDAPDGVDPIIYRSQIIQAMAARYQQAVSNLSNEEAHDSAMSTWDTEWEADPAPRTVLASYTEVDADLSYWGEE